MKSFQLKTTILIAFLFFIITGGCQNKKSEEMNTFSGFSMLIIL